MFIYKLEFQAHYVRLYSSCDSGRVAPSILVLLMDGISLSLLFGLLTDGITIFYLCDELIGCFVGKKVTDKQTNKLTVPLLI